MATNTCKSVIVYQNLNDRINEPFASQKESLAEQMFTEGKASYFPNSVHDNDVAVPGQRVWNDTAAAQEFIDWVLINAPISNVPITSATIVDYQQVDNDPELL